MFILPVLLLTLFVGNPAFSADLQKGFDPAQNGDYATALKELRPLAKKGNANAQLFLGVMYNKGQGTLQDFTRAHMWWNISASQGDEVARKNRDKAEKKTTPTQLQTAKRLARECVEKNYKGC